MKSSHTVVFAVIGTMLTLLTVNADSTAPLFNQDASVVAPLQASPEGTVEGIDATQPTQLINGLSAPELLLSSDGNLDIGKAANIISFKVSYPSFGPGHRVTLSWVGATTFNTPTQATTTTLPLTFNVPQATVAKDFGSSATVTYTVEVPGAPPQKSEPLTVNIMLGELQAPEFPLAVEGKIDIGKAPLQVPVRVAYPSLAAGQQVILSWGGANPYKAAAQNTISTAPLTFNIPREVIARDFGTSVPVSYTVAIAGVPLQTSAVQNVQVTFGNLPPPGLPLAVGVDTALNLNNRYADIRDTCEESKPAYYCNGVVLRATQNGNFDPWNPSPSAVTLGGVSFSYLRKDAFVTTVYHNSGFTFRPQQDALRLGQGVDYLCIYPYDAWTAQPRRPDAGCGLQPKAAQPTDLSTCAAANAATVEGWYAFTNTLTHPQYQCSLSVQDPGQFATSLKVRANRLANMPDAWNEILIKVWEQNVPAQLPIESFFYKNPAGLVEAKAYQQKYAARTAGRWVPIVKLDLSKLDGSPFSYSSTDQAVQP